MPIESRYVLEEGAGSYGFEVGAGYDPALPLVIDPGLAYSTFLGGTKFDEGVGIAVDEFGNAYVTGDTPSDDYPTTPGAFETTYNGGSGDTFVTKLPTTGGSCAPPCS